MSIVFDLILVAIILTCIIIGFCRGFIKSLAGFISYIISFAIANTLYRLVAYYVIKLPFLQKMITDVTMPDFGESESFLDRIQVIFKYLADTGALTNPDGLSDTVRAVVQNYAAELFAAIIAFSIVFFVILFLLKLILWVLDRFARSAPGLKQANGIFGGVVGLLDGFFWTWIASGVFVRFIFPMLNNKWPELFGPEMIESFVVQLCTKINPITYLFLLINKISG